MYSAVFVYTQLICYKTYNTMSTLALVGIVAQIIPVFFIIKIGISMITKQEFSAAADKHAKAAPVN